MASVAVMAVVDAADEAAAELVIAPPLPTAPVHVVTPAVAVMFVLDPALMLEMLSLVVVAQRVGRRAPVCGDAAARRRCPLRRH
jgi:hypothetical protein